jgi:hypothetical protein
MAQDASATHGILGYLDPKTGAFHLLPALQDSEPPATTTVTGKIVANFTITVDSTVASTAKIGCEFEATLVDVTTGNTLLETAASAVTRGSGTTVTCTATIPYSWTLGSASTDKVSLSWGIVSPVTTSASAPSGFPFRLSQHSMGTISVPANGATTTETIAATI